MFPPIQFYITTGLRAYTHKYDDIWVAYYKPTVVVLASKPLLAFVKVSLGRSSWASRDDHVGARSADARGLVSAAVPLLRRQLDFAVALTTQFAVIRRCKVCYVA